MPAEAIVLLDDRLLVEELLVGLRTGRRRPTLFTTSYWYYRACRAAVAGAGGQLSGPFEQLPPLEQERAILSLLELREDLGLPDPRRTVPVMGDVARRHPHLNLLNVEAWPPLLSSVLRCGFRSARLEVSSPACSTPRECGGGRSRLVDRVVAPVESRMR